MTKAWTMVLGGGQEKWPGSRFVLNAERTGLLLDLMGMGCERKIGIRDNTKFLLDE